MIPNSGAEQHRDEDDERLHGYGSPLDLALDTQVSTCW